MSNIDGNGFVDDYDDAGDNDYAGDAGNIDDDDCVAKRGVRGEMVHLDAIWWQDRRRMLVLMQMPDDGRKSVRQSCASRWQERRTTETYKQTLCHDKPMPQDESERPRFVPQQPPR